MPARGQLAEHRLQRTAVVVVEVRPFLVQPDRTAPLHLRPRPMAQTQYSSIPFTQAALRLSSFSVEANMKRGRKRVERIAVFFKIGLNYPRHPQALCHEPVLQSRTLPEPMTVSAPMDKPTGLHDSRVHRTAARGPRTSRKSPARKQATKR